jgi:hypothetical protein
VAGNNIIDATEGAATSTTLTGKATGAFAAGDVVTLTVNDVKFSGIVDASGMYSIAVTTANLKADTDTRVEARIDATVPGSTVKQTAIAAQDYVVESTPTPTQTAISIDPVATDNIINSAESTTTTTTITGKVTGVFAANDIVTLMVKGAPVTGTVNALGIFSINVPTADLVADSDTQIEASVTGTGGTYATALQNYAVDTVVPAGDITIDAITGDDFLTANETASTATVTITGTVTGEYKAGDVVTIKVNGTGTPYSGTVNATGQYSVSGVPGAALGAGSNVAASMLAHDGASNSATYTNTRPYTVDSNTEALKTALTLDPVAGNNIIEATEGAATSTTLTEIGRAHV